MTKKSIKEREVKRNILSKKFFTKRINLKKIISNININPQERWQAMLQLQKFPRDSSLSRKRNRCFQTGRPRSFFKEIWFKSN